MDSTSVLTASLVLILLVQKAVALKCYECNVWKAGYGHQCDNPRIRDQCNVCIKIYTFSYMGYYKSTPRSTNVTSRICSKDKTPYYSHECFRYSTADGYSHRCYCDQDLCNGGNNIQASALTFTAVTSLLTYLFSCANG